jgi:hypothetical protein
MNNNNKFKDSAIKILAIIGVVGILFVGGFLTVTIFGNLPNIASRLTAQVVNITQRFIPSERIIVTLDEENPRDGDTINLSFEHLSKEEDGSYSFFYECREGVHLERGGEIVFCNTPLNFINKDNTLSFEVFSTNTNEVDVPLSINFIRNNSTKISERGEVSFKINETNVIGNTSDGGTILVTNNNRDDNENTNNTGEIDRTAGDKIEETFLFNETSGTTAGISDPNGQVDLRAKILEIGEIDRTTNVFTATSSVHKSSRGAIKFEVENIGTKNSGSWTFNLVLPTFPRHIYYSKNQQTLLPGDKIEYIIGFDSIKNDDDPNTITVNIDPTNSVKEGDETNNIVKRNLITF